MANLLAQRSRCHGRRSALATSASCRSIVFDQTLERVLYRRTARTVIASVARTTIGWDHGGSSGMGWPVWFSSKSRLVELPWDTTIPGLVSGAKPGGDDAVI